MPQLTPLLDRALTARASYIDPRHESAFRLFNGFLEGWPALAIDIYGATAVFHDHADPPQAGNQAATEAVEFVRGRLPESGHGVGQRQLSD